jgi:hypothetical protein
MSDTLKLIQETRESMKKLQKQEDELFGELEAYFGEDNDEKSKDFLFDYIYNGTEHSLDWIKEKYEKLN